MFQSPHSKKMQTRAGVNGQGFIGQVRYSIDGWKMSLNQNSLARHLFLNEKLSLPSLHVFPLYINHELR